VRPRFPAATFRVPPMESWNQPLFPAGTYFEWPKRLWNPDGHLRVRGPALQAMREALPHYSNVVRAAVRDRLGDKATAADLKREYGSLVEYDINVMENVAWASRDDPAEYKRLMRRIGGLNPDRLGSLGYYLVEQGEFEEAAHAYEEYVARARDRVGVSNSVRWLVNYHFDKGDKKRALEVAQEAAAVYSGAGLTTLALLYERMGRWEDAEEYFQKLVHRYEGNEPTLLAFYVRRQRAAKEGGASAQREALLRKVFPTGLETVASQDTGAPKDGVQVVKSSRQGKRAGLAAGDVIVAVDGLRVHTHDQYLTIRELRRDPEMTLRVWRRDRYVNLTSQQFDRWFSMEAKTHNGPAEAERKYI